MLVLTRMEAEAVRIGQDIEIIVLHIGNGRTRLGIRAPRHMSIVRCKADLPEDQEVEVGA